MRWQLGLIIKIVKGGLQTCNVVLFLTEYNYLEYDFDDCSGKTKYAKICPPKQ